MNRKEIRFPEKGLDEDDMFAELKAHRADDASWRNGRMFGYIYHPGNREAKAIEQAYTLFLNENALNPSLFSSLRRLENETVAMVADLLHAGDGFAGNLTTGGSESILVAVKTERDWARKHKPGKREPEIIAPVTTHPAFSKAADMTGVRAKYAPVTDDRRVDVAEVEKLINSNTIAITASAPCFPYGVIDPVEEMADAVMKTTQRIRQGIETIPGLIIIAKPVMSVFSFTSDRHDIYSIGDELSKRGWNLDKLQFPSALHMTVSFDNTGHEDEFLDALKESIAAVEGQKIKTASSHVLASVVRAISRFLPEKWFKKLSARFTALMNRGDRGSAATGAAAYGMMVAIDNRENVDEIMLDVLDKLYSV